MRYAPPVLELRQIERPKGAPANWGYCGIAAISAATAVAPLKVFSLMPGWRGFTPSKLLTATLDKLGYGCTRRIVPQKAQQGWPVGDGPSVAVGRLYWGEGRFAGSHWVCFFFPEGHQPPLLYDNSFQDEMWRDTAKLQFYASPTKLKSLYWLERKEGGTNRVD